MSHPILAPRQPESSQPWSVTSQHGVTITVQSVEYSDDSTIVTLHNQVDPAWGMEPSALNISSDIFAPNQVDLNLFTLTDDLGNTIIPLSGAEGFLEADPATGGLQSENHVTFVAIPADAKTLTFTIDSLALSRLHADQPLQIDLSDRDVGERWTVDQNIVI